MKFAALILALAFAAFAQLQPPPAATRSLQDPNSRPPLPKGLEAVGIDQKLNSQIPLDLHFNDEFGRSMPLSTYFNSGKPVLLALVYFRCPMLCSQILTGVESSLKAVTFTPGKDFEVVAVSFDPKDKPEIAAAKKQTYLKRYGRPSTANGWHFLTGDEANIKALTQAVGFRYRYDEATDQFAHASGIMIVTPQGKLSKYYYGVDYAPREVRLGLVEASQNKIGNPVDQILLFCYHYDPVTGKYGAVVMNMIRLAGGGFALVAGALLFVAIRRDVKGKAQLRRAG